MFIKGCVLLVSQQLSLLGGRIHSRETLKCFISVQFKFNREHSYHFGWWGRGNAGVRPEPPPPDSVRIGAIRAVAKLCGDRPFTDAQLTVVLANLQDASPAVR